MPQKCPACGSIVKKYPDEVALRCDNISCSAQQKERIIHFASRQAMDIDGLGQAIVELLVENKLVLDISDLYHLKYEQLIKLSRMADKSVKNLLNAVEQSKTRELSRLIFALGIRHVGVHAAEILASEFNSIKNIAKQNQESLSSIAEIGPVVASAICGFFNNKNNMKLLEKLANAGVGMQQLKKTAGTKLSGKRFVLTGTLSSLSRFQAEDLIKHNGGKVASSVSKNIDFVLLGENPGSKYQKAKKLNIRMIEEVEFKKMIK